MKKEDEEFRMYHQKYIDEQLIRPVLDNDELTIYSVGEQFYCVFFREKYKDLFPGYTFNNSATKYLAENGEIGFLELYKKLGSDAIENSMFFCTEDTMNVVRKWKKEGKLSNPNISQEFELELNELSIIQPESKTK